MVYGFLSMLGYVVLLFSLPNYARTIGLSAQQGSIIGALLNLGQALGRPPIGYFSDSFGRLNMAGTMTFLCGLSCLVIWMFARSFGVVVFFGVLAGTVAGTFWATVAPVTAEVMGIKRLPSALNITWLVLVLPTTCKFDIFYCFGPMESLRVANNDAVSEPIGLEIVAFNGGTYTGAIFFTGFMYVGAAVSLWMVRAWKIGDSEDKAAAEKGGSVEGTFRKTPFVKRIFMWRKV
jgi:MFS family permease